jgi:hypothetical protein
MSRRYGLRHEAGSEFFATRVKARHIREAIDSLPDVAVAGVVLDFDGVQAITGAFADELVCSLADDGLLTAVVSANPDVRDTLATALDRRGISRAVITSA